MESTALSGATDSAVCVPNRSDRIRSTSAALRPPGRCVRDFCRALPRGLSNTRREQSAYGAVPATRNVAESAGAGSKDELHSRLHCSMADLLG